MAVDTSAIIAILLQEPDAERFSRALAEAPSRLVSVATLLEASMVIETRKGPEGGRDLDLLIYRAQIDIVPVDRSRRRSRGREVHLEGCADRHHRSPQGGSKAIIGSGVLENSMGSRSLSP